MLTRRNRNKKDERGASLVEFALILPVLAAITFGMLSAGVVYNHKMDVTHASREGARYGATVPAAQCTPTSNCGGLTWADLVQSVVAERSFGDVTATDSQVCVALVTGANSVYSPSSSYSTDGTTCYDDGGADTGERVHVKITKTGDKINAVLFRANVTLTSKATAKFES
jgi:Flp pilus assembly protein TadG